MLQSFVAWCQLISSHPTSCMVLVGNWMPPDPFPQGPPIPQRGGRVIIVHLYPESILLSLLYLIWSSFQYLILTYILETYFSIHAYLAWNQLSSSYPTSCIAVGWRSDDPQPFPGSTHFTGGGGLMGYDHDHGRWGKDPEPGTYMYSNIYLYVYMYINIYIKKYIYVKKVLWNILMT